MQRASKAQQDYIARLQQELGEQPDFAAIRALYGPAASRLIDALKVRAAGSN